MGVNCDVAPSPSKGTGPDAAAVQHGPQGNIAAVPRPAGFGRHFAAIAQDNAVSLQLNISPHPRSVEAAKIRSFSRRTSPPSTRIFPALPGPSMATVTLPPSV
ncbi:MAG: hypothetical protein SWY16_26895 [Cyanobacteriota bacterium]|nr:hypothetical protein [Cyanobacteriota bacterium]